MPVAAWFYSEPDPVRSGELRRLGLPALLVEQFGWESHLLSADRPVPVEACDVAIFSAQALRAIAAVTLWRPRPAILVDLDDQTVVQDAGALDAIMLAAGRIDAIVTRGPAATEWASNSLAGRVASLFLPDIADRDAELRAVALRFGLWSQDVPPPRERFSALWFSEPGDLVSEDEIGFVLDQAREASAQSGALLAVAPQPILEWLRQTGPAEPVRSEVWSSGGIDQIFTRTRGLDVALPNLPSTERRRAKCTRYGIVSGEKAAASAFSPAAVGTQWVDLLRSHATHYESAVEDRPVTLLLLLDLIQDIPLSLPIVELAANTPGMKLRVAVTSWLTEEKDQVVAELRKRGVEPEIYDRRTIVNGAAPSLDGVDALLTVVETTLNAHKRGHLLTLRAQSLAIPTFTLQHGLENVALTYFDEIHDQSVDIHSDHIFVWFPLEDVPAVVPAKIRPRLVHVGRPRSAPRAELPRELFDNQRMIAVFENLHWHRYDRRFRERFMQDCFAMAQAFPDQAIVLKPHPAGQWTAKLRAELTDWPRNLLLADPGEAMWANLTADGLISSAEMVITTPSSVVIDALQLNRPVAVAGYGLDLPLYSPLPILRRFDDWINFVSSSHGSIQAAQARARFATRMNLTGSSEVKIVNTILEVARNRLRRPMQ
jgi:hypothetical protein